MSLGDRLFRAWLRLLPEEFRAAYARDMEATFRAERREAVTTGRWARLARLWVATLGDLMRRAPGQHRDVLVRDLRFALRLMRARPLPTITAVLTLAIGIGANVAMFAVADAVLLDPLAYRDPDAVVRVAETARGGDAGPTGFLTFVDLQNASRTLGSIAAASGSALTLTGDGRQAERISAMRVSRTYFDLVGVFPAIGRPFNAEEDRPGEARRVLILSDGLWRRRFDADPGVINRALDIGGFTYRIIGVMPPGFEDLVAERVFGGVDAWSPLGYDPAASYACRTCRHLQVFGRLAPGVTTAAAERELSQIFASLERAHPTQYHAAGAEVKRLSDVFLGPVRPVVFVLWVAVGLLLVVACANVANLLLLRASERSQEVAIRAALGVTRTRLARQLITEAILLGAIGAAVGLIPASIAIRLVATYGPQQIPRLAHAAFDARAAAVAVILAIGCGILFGLVPLRQLLRRDFGSAMQAGVRRTESVATWRLRASLVIVNIAMAAFLVVGSGLLVRSLVGLLSVSPGFDSSNVLTMRLFAGGPAFRAGEPPQQIATTVRFYEDLLTRIRALPGVTAASAVTTLPLGGNVDGYGFHIEGRLHANPQEAPSADRFVVSPDFFKLLRIPLIRGRLLEPSDSQTTEAVAVINRTAAAELFPGEDPIGRRVMLGPPDAPPRRIVGIVGDVRHHGLDIPVRYQVYAPQAQWVWAETWMTLVIRSDRDPLALAGPVRDVLHSIDPTQPISDIRLYDDVVASSTSARRFAANLLSVFALTALTLAVIGLSGALGVVVGQRQREIGVRLALGARPGKIAGMVFEQGLRPAIIGVVIGLFAAAASVGAIRALLYQVDALNPATYVTSAVLLIGCAVAACLGPAIRASRIEPALALRGE